MAKRAKNSPKKNTRTKYRIYPKITHTTHKNMAVLKEFRKADKWEALRGYMQRDPEYFNFLTCVLIANEVSFDRSGANAIFLGMNDIDSLLKGKYSVSRLPSVFTPYPSFMLCLPSEFEHRGLKPSGVLVTACDGSMFNPESIQKVGKELCKPDLVAEGLIKPPHKRGLSICYKVQGDDCHTSFSLYDENLDMILAQDSFDNYLEFQHNISKSYHQNFAETLSDDEYYLQYKILRLVLGLSVYTLAKEGALHDGFPKVKGFALDTPFGEPTRSSSLVTSRTHASPDEHHRTWFLRQLMHSKYYQGEYADYAPNSRFVFVDETTINAKVSPKHIT